MNLSLSKAVVYENQQLIFSFNSKYFSWLNEAITEELAIRLTNEAVVNPPAFFERPAEYVRKNREQMAEQGMDEEAIREFFPAQQKPEQGGYQVYWYPSAYKEERNKMWDIIERLAKANTISQDAGEFDMDAEREKIFNQFARSAFNGDVLLIGRSIEKTFGKGTFRKLGEGDFSFLTDSTQP
ncbi:MAG: hypothetical protein HYT41_02585 [Candidatus Sungbacteria bacterium]|nr:hypothetical protein [Candidatus Sungbacteria bacterium]